MSDRLLPALIVALAIIAHAFLTAAFDGDLDRVVPGDKQICACERLWATSAPIDEGAGNE